MRFSRKLAVWFLGLVILLPLATAGIALIWWSMSLPKLNGEVRLAGLGEETRVVRDNYGVPHIFAANMNDAARALGYLHAQDRFFQMIVTRRVLQGRLSEVIGERGLSIDRLFRTLDLESRAKDSLSALSPELRAYLTAYSEGVNSWLEESWQLLPFEFTLLGLEPQPWTPEDSILWGKGMAWKLSANWRHDLTRGLLAQHFDRQKVERFFPAYRQEWPITLRPEIGRGTQRRSARHAPAPSATSSTAEHSLLSALASLPSIGTGASNEWVIDGTRTVTGAPMLANDPHLEFEIPILWYLARIVTPELTIAGATAPGVPIILLGQNGHIAWSFTTTDSDAQDLFIETAAPDQPDHYLTPDGPQPIRTETVTIEVKGEAPIPYTRRETRHGPVISDAVRLAGALAKDGKFVSLAWNGLSREDTSAEALFRVNRAQDWQAFQDALALHISPAQNIAYADSDGNIGFVNAGLVPLRKSGRGRYPVDGASGAFDWIGRVSPQGWPKLFNPPAGAIVNANNSVVAADYPHWFGTDQTAPYRAIRIIERLAAREKHTLDSLADIQLDIRANHAPDLVPFLLKLEPQTPLERKALALIEVWDFSADRDRPETLIFDWWLLRMNEELLKSGLEPLSPTAGKLNPQVVLSVLSEPRGFCETDEAGADCMGAVRIAFEKTLEELSQRYGPDPTQWQWGDEHVAVMENRVLDNIPGFRTLFGQPFPSNGGYYSVNRGGNHGPPEAMHPLQRESGAGFRAVYDLDNPARSRFIIATGQSSHPLSPFYADQLALYRVGEMINLELTEAELAAQEEGTLVFRPQTD